ncbi:hypothetical protein ANN_08497 [Periplaneta americana]|uniref:Uncharacterized protein n=1 Tax=Periplaneta americana TaxID=6978 RepID=A0ABQ8T303_PERAM|nr:hypothetical protein ANN_08497 [Periplaneta americana]
MAGLCEGGNESPGSLKANKWMKDIQAPALLCNAFVLLSLGFSEPTHASCDVRGPPRTNPGYTRDSEWFLQLRDAVPREQILLQLANGTWICVFCFILKCNTADLMFPSKEKRSEHQVDRECN